MTPKKKGIRIPHMFTLLLLIIAVCTILTYVIPAGQYETYVDENGVEMLVDGSYHRIEQTPVTPMKALMAVQEGLIETAVGTPVEMADLNDAKHCADLLLAFVCRKLEPIK